MFGFGKKNFKASLLQPTGGLISGMFFSNPIVGIKTNLFFQIKIELLPFEYDGEKEQTCIQLDFINLPIGNYLELEGRNFTFPTNPKEGYIDGSVYIAGMHNPFDVTQISFGEADDKGIFATVKAKMLFEDNSIKPTDIVLDTKLDFGGIEIHCDEIAAMANQELLDFAFRKLDQQRFYFNTENQNFEWKR